MSLSTKSSRQFQTDLIRKIGVYVTASYYDPYFRLLSGGDLLWPWSLLQQQGRKSEFLLTATENWKYLKIIHSLSQQKYVIPHRLPNSQPNQRPCKKLLLCFLPLRIRGFCSAVSHTSVQKLEFILFPQKTLRAHVADSPLCFGDF